MENERELHEGRLRILNMNNTFFLKIPHLNSNKI